MNDGIVYIIEVNFIPINGTNIHDRYDDIITINLRKKHNNVNNIKYIFTTNL